MYEHIQFYLCKLHIYINTISYILFVVAKNKNTNLIFEMQQKSIFDIFSTLEWPRCRNRHQANYE